MPHPLERSPRAFGPVLLLTLALMVVLGRADEALRTPEAPFGILSFELAGDAASAGRMVASWDAGARAWAAFSLGIDFLFPLAYSTAIAFACLWAGRVLGMTGLAAGLAWGQWLAAALDYGENVGLVRILLLGAGDPWPAIARACAIPKFALVAAGLVFVLIGAVARLAGRRARGLR